MTLIGSKRVEIKFLGIKCLTFFMKKYAQELGDFYSNKAFVGSMVA